MKMEMRMSHGRRVKLVVAALVMIVATMMISGVDSSSHDYADALSKCILFFEGQRSGKLPPTQRMTWRNDSGLRDGHEIGVDLVGGYYDAGDNVKFNFPMAFSITMLSWSVVEFGKLMGTDRPYALDAIRWGTDYLLKATGVPGLVFVQVGEPYNDHMCWERPEDMDTARTPYAVSSLFPGSEVSGEIAAALAASSLVFKQSDPNYSAVLLDRAKTVFDFGDKYRGSYNESLGPWVCPFYCDFSSYEDELLWAAAWLFKATKTPKYWNYVQRNYMNKLDVGKLCEFGWDSKHAGINVLLSKIVPTSHSAFSVITDNANRFICSVLPESPTKSVQYSPGGLLFKQGGSNLQHATSLFFLLLVYAGRLSRLNRTIRCGDVVVAPDRLIQLAHKQVDYILGDNPLKMSYMVGYGDKYPQFIHHRGSSLPSLDEHPQRIGCGGGSSYFYSTNPNPNVLTGAIVGGPNITDSYDDCRDDFVRTEPTTYINAPFVGVLAFFKSHSTSLRV